ncbi:MAG: C39 family peptidase [Candidatus Dormibacteraeota bacterium]|nr:C39 family peptidase [Candidatus Dormibacteraeota bacterium]
MPVPRWAILALASLVCWAGAASVGYHQYQRLQAEKSPAPPQTQAVVNGPLSAAPTATAPPTGAPSATPTPAPTPTPVPVSLQIQGVPFTIQAPFQKWDAAHEEYCEAATVLMVGQYFEGDHRSLIPPAEADSTMAKFVAWERASYRSLDLRLDQIAQVGAQFYKVQGSVVPLDLDQLKQHLAAGRPVIIPVMTWGGPGGTKIYPTYGGKSVYHVIVVIGYDSAQDLLYTNDPGLKEGRGLAYKWAVLSSAIDAQTSSPATTVRQGRVMLVFQPK